MLWTFPGNQGPSEIHNSSISVILPSTFRLNRTAHFDLIFGLTILDHFEYCLHAGKWHSKVWRNGSLGHPNPFLDWLHIELLHPWQALSTLRQPRANGWHLAGGNYGTQGWPTNARDIVGWLGQFQLLSVGMPTLAHFAYRMQRLAQRSLQQTARQIRSHMMAS